MGHRDVRSDVPADAGHRGAAGRASRAARAGAVALAATLTALSVLAVSASALIQRGHESTPSLSFGRSGEGALLNPAGVAVSEVGAASGDVYVVDRGHNRVVQFNQDGGFVSAWGWGVANGEKTYQVCKAGEGCRSGTPGTGKGLEKFHLGPKQLVAPEAIAVDDSRLASDPSAGDVYVVADVAYEKSYLYKFSPTGEFLRRVTSTEETEEHGRIDGVAVNSRGEVWVAWSEDGEVTRFNDAAKNKREGEEGYEVEISDSEAMRPGFAVDADNNLYLNFEPAQTFAVAGEESPYSEEGRGPHGERPCEATRPCFVAKLTSGEEGERKAELGEAFIAGLFGETTTAIAVDLSTDDVYLDNGTSIAAYAPSGAFIQRFGEGRIAGGAGLAVDDDTGAVYVADAAADEVRVFQPEGGGQPRVDGLAATKPGTASVQLEARVDPDGTETSVSFEYGTESCATGSCTSVAGTPSVIGDSGEEARNYGDREVTATISELTPGTTYHYRVVAASADGTVRSAEQTVATLPFTLPDHRAWEMVSPVARNGAGVESLPKEGGVIEAAEDGDALTYITTGPSESAPEGNRSPAFTQNLATRVTGADGEPEWKSEEIAIRDPERAPGVSPGKQQEYLFFSPDLRSALVQPVGRFKESEPQLSTEASEKTIYIRDDEQCAPPPSSCYTPIVYPGNDTAQPQLAFGGIKEQPDTGVRFLDATADLSHVVLSSEVPLTEEATAQPSNLYEWNAATRALQLVNVLPGEEGKEGPPAAGNKLDLGTLGQAATQLRRNAISEEAGHVGERVVWSVEPKSGNAHLYVRDMAARQTVQVDAPEAGAKLGSAETPIFQAANTADTRVFFTDEQRLTTSSRSPDEAGVDDLYVYESATGALTDLTVPRGAEAAGVQGMVLGASQDGATVYFVANGVLSENSNLLGESASPGDCLIKESEIPGATCNLYVDRYIDGEWQRPQFIAALSNQDLPDWGQLSRQDLGEVPVRVSPDGNYLAFMSQRPLTGYDNHAVNAGAEGTRAEEVYLFDDASGRLKCVSCNPTGARPNAVLDTEQSGEGLGLLVDRPEVWAEGGHWLAGSLPGWTQNEGDEALYQSRYLSDSGRLFFNSADALVPADVNGKEDVYEFEEDGEGTCAAAEGCVSLISSGTSAQESAFLDASASGDDVFFLSAAPLVASDKESGFAVYDARVCTAASPCVQVGSSSSHSCESNDECKAAAGNSEPVYTPPPSATASGSNLAAGKTEVLPAKTTKAAKPTRAQELAKALKACRKLKRKSRRVVCERTARKRYGPKTAAKSKGKK